jgi:ribosomal protein S18 acetylase RimI-like enzyme
MIKIIKAASQKEIDDVCELFLEYSASLNFNLDFQNFEHEIKNLPGEYSAPFGKLYLALYKNQPAGCVALKKISSGYCEMKRLFVRSKFRGMNIGKALTEIIIHEAQRVGYKFMRLDTVPAMSSARKLYKEFGFKEIPPYRFNPVEGAVYLELDLGKEGSINVNVQDYLECCIQFNPWKHHKNYICKKIKYYSSQKDAGIKEIKKKLKQIGKSQLDLYAGELSLQQIIQNISGDLLKQNVTDKLSFISWLREFGKDYRNIMLKDDSGWTLRLSEKDEKFIHVHPARNSLNTVRVRAAALKTAVAAIFVSQTKSISPMDLNIINEARKKYLNESPVKTIYKNSGLGKIILLLKDEIS